MVTSQLQTVARWSQTDTGYDVRMSNSCEKDMFHERAFFTVFACIIRFLRLIVVWADQRTKRPATCKL